MDKQEAGALAYRLTQLENNLHRAESKVAEAELHIQSVYGHLENAKQDLLSLKVMIKQ